MGDQLWIAALLLGVFVLYVVAKVRAYMRQSDRNWREVDKTKLEQWDDEDEW